MLFGSQPFPEDAAAFALSTHFDEVDAMRNAYERRARALARALDGARNISARMPGEDFARRLLAEHSVVTMPGESFGAGGAGHVRVALTVSEADISEACRRMRDLADGS